MTEDTLGFSDTTTAEDKANGNIVLLFFPVPGEVPQVTNSCLCHSTPAPVSPAAASPRHALTSFSNLKCCRNCTVGLPLSLLLQINSRASQGKLLNVYSI